MRFPLFLALALLLAATSQVAAQEKPSPLPPSGIQDDARLFNPEQTARLTELIAATLEQQGVHLTVATFTYTSGITVSQRTQRLAMDWLGETPGVVFAFDRGSSQPAIAVSPGLWRRFPSDDITMTILRTSTVFIKEGTPQPDARMIEAIESAAARFASLEAVRRARLQVFTRDDRQLATGVVIVLGLLGLGALWLSRSIRHKHAEQHETFLFPEVHVGMRLGAPYGGGTAAEVKGRP